ncbi:MAG: ABC transporter substrate-binding protein [Spirochaetaceae bacterium]|jgi:simple sugar transport system substrate-binding protein|nr:ABC transporter substrate-binding protein [Spirochaetaceae bacterium]
MKRSGNRAVYLIFFLLCAGAVLSCQRSPKAEADQGRRIILGFSQIGAESAWRNCNSRSVQEAAAEAGIQLLFSNAEQKQENQIKAIRSYIAYQVDVIAFVPIVADGWDNVLQEAKDAGIPVLVTDRKINIKDESLYAGFIGTDSVEEGRSAGRFLLEKFRSRLGRGEPIRIVELSGTVGSSPAVGRAEGFREILGSYPQFQIVFSESGDFLRSKGYELMRAVLDTHRDIDAIFSHNDGMTLGVLDAMKERGLNPGVDIVIITVDAEQAAIDALIRGELNCVIECNPKQGPGIMKLALALARGERIEPLIHVEERVFYEGEDLSTLEPRGY